MGLKATEEWPIFDLSLGVTTPRKLSMGLKEHAVDALHHRRDGYNTEKTQHGIERRRRHRPTTAL